MTVPPAISPMVTISAALRPLTSPSRPMRIPPSGRMKKPTPKAANVDSSEVTSSPVGKKVLATTRAM